jgi:hypothetical protein
MSDQAAIVKGLVEKSQELLKVHGEILAEQATITERRQELSAAETRRDNLAIRYAKLLSEIQGPKANLGFTSDTDYRVNQELRRLAPPVKVGKEEAVA